MKLAVVSYASDVLNLHVPDPYCPFPEMPVEDPFGDLRSHAPQFLKIDLDGGVGFR